MKKVTATVTKADKNHTTSIRYQETTGHMIFDLKLGESFRRKDRFIGDGHKTETPASLTYSTVISRDSVRICLMIVALNDLDIKCADIENAYLTAPCTMQEKMLDSSWP